VIPSSTVSFEERLHRMILQNTKFAYWLTFEVKILWLLAQASFAAASSTRYLGRDLAGRWVTGPY
jgi:hypothetical protein